MGNDLAASQVLMGMQRSEREVWPSTFGLRIHRAISWVGRAEEEQSDPAASFLFLWIAFNAVYGVDRSMFGERDAFQIFFHRLCRFDGAHGRYGIVWSDFPGPIRLFRENRCVFTPFWAQIYGETGSDDWEQSFNASKRRFHIALRDRDTVTVLSLLFDRLYVLRNRVMHAGATWGSKVNRDQLRDGAVILSSVVPVLFDLMMDEPDGNWGAPMYPMVEV